MIVTLTLSTHFLPHLRYRAAELKHGRIAMLAALGQITQYYVRLGDPVFSQVEYSTRT